jgi:rubrerythrin
MAKLDRKGRKDSLTKRMLRFVTRLSPDFLYTCLPKNRHMYYSGQEIIEIAVRIEENGHAFYTAAAENIKESNDVKSLFLDLAEKEVMHIAIFQKLADRFESEKFEFNEDETADYLNYMAESHIFGKPGAGSDLAQKVVTPKEALSIAFKFENDSVTFYEELLKRTETDAKKMISQIIEEEKEHASDIKKFM